MHAAKRRGGLLLILLTGIAVAACQQPTDESAANVVGLVAAASPEAAAAGVAILEAGGNAIDAAVAVQFALAVTEPAMSGLGGQTQLLLHAPGEVPIVINGTSFSPAATDPQVTRDDLTGHRAMTVPATVRTLGYAWQNHGSGQVAWADLIAPAIRYAEDGFVVGPFRAAVFARHADDLAAHPSTRALFLDADGAVPATGDTLWQPALARTLRHLAEHGAEAFYEGVLADAIAQDMVTHDGWITAEDLRMVPEPTEMAPLHTTYRGTDVYSLPPPGGGWVVLQILNLLEQSPPESLRTDARVARLAEALRIGHTSRRDDPIEDFTRYDAAVAKRLSKERARALLAEAAADSQEDVGETTHFTVVDAEGRIVAATASINAYFGARVAHPELGILYNSYMHEYEFGQPGHPFALRPNARPYSSMSPTIAARDGVPILGIGSPGSARIISAVAQVTQQWLDDAGVSIAEAVAQPRLHVVPPNRLYLESDALRRQRGTALESAGYALVDPSTDLMQDSLNAYFGGIHAVAYRDGRWTGAADPRRDGVVLMGQQR